MSNKINIDGWANLMTRMGTLKDKKSFTGFTFPGRLDQGLLSELYRGDGLAKKIIDIPIFYQLKEWFKIEGDTENKFQDVYKKIKFRKYLKKHLTNDSLNGGSGLVMGLEDGGEIWEPVNWNRLKKINFFATFNRWEISTNEAYNNDEINNPNYGEYEFYDVYPPSGMSFMVHKDRIHILDGTDISNRERQANDGWGDSSLQAPYEYIKRLGNTYGSLESIIDDFINTILSIENLQQLLATGQEDLIQKRMEIIDMTKSLISTILLDTKETYEKKSSSVAGLSDLVGKLEIALAAVSWIPATILMGQSPVGMNATGKSDEDAFYDRISFLQGDKLLDVIDRVNNIIIRCSEYDVPREEDPTVEFCPLRQPTQKEIIDTRKVQAETDQAYINSGVLLENEVRMSRFGGETYSHDTIIEGEIEPGDREPEPEPKEGEENNENNEGDEE